MGNCGVRRGWRAAMLIVAATVGVLLALPTAGYADSTCTTAISNQTLGNVLVPAGQTCTLTDDTITGNITNYGVLNLTTNDTPIGGNVTLEPGSQTSQTGGTTWTINGNLTLNATELSNLGSDVLSIGKNLTVENGINGFFAGNMIHGNLVWRNNTDSSVIGGNTVGHNISCSGNNPAPTNGGMPNTVGGQETGQCAGMG